MTATSPVFRPHITEFSLRPIWNGNGEHMDIVCTIQTTPNETKTYRFEEINMERMTLSFISKIIHDITMKGSFFESGIAPNFIEVIEIFEKEAKKAFRETQYDIPNVPKRKRADVHL